MTLESARALLEQLAQPPAAPLPPVTPVLPAVVNERHWRFSDGHTWFVDLGDQLDELAAWLEYATGAKAWDPAIDGQTWQF